MIIEFPYISAPIPIGICHAVPTTTTTYLPQPTSNKSKFDYIKESLKTLLTKNNMAISSQRTLAMFVGVVVLRRNSHKHHRNPLTKL